MAEEKKSNSVFQGLQKYADYNACVGENGGRYDLYDYACGYFEATDTLLKAVKHGKCTIDDIVYPTCLTFRHKEAKVGIEAGEAKFKVDTETPTALPAPNPDATPIQ
jgi:hypothetical protein